MSRSYLTPTEETILQEIQDRGGFIRVEEMRGWGALERNALANLTRKGRVGYDASLRRYSFAEPSPRSPNYTKRKRFLDG